MSKNYFIIIYLIITKFIRNSYMFLTEDGKNVYFQIEIDHENDKFIYGPIVIYSKYQNVSYYFQLTTTHHINFLPQICQYYGYFKYWKLLEACENLKSYIFLIKFLLNFKFFLSI